MWLAHQKYGSLPWQELVQPAVELAWGKVFLWCIQVGGYIERHIERLAEDGFDVNFKDYLHLAI